MANIAFLTFEFTQDNLRKQPWNYVYTICQELLDDGHNVVIITDGSSHNMKQDIIDGLPIYVLPKIKPWNHKSIIEILKTSNSDLIFWSFTPKGIVYYPLFKKIRLPLFLFISIPLYNIKQVIRAQIALGRYNLINFYQNCLIPKFLIKRIINSTLLKGIITPTLNNRRKLLEYGSNPNKVFYIPHGKDPKSSQAHDKQDFDASDMYNMPPLPALQNTNCKVLLYMGGPQKIRGLTWLITAFSRALAQANNLHLIILLRSEKQADFQAIENECKDKGIYGKTTIISGILSPKEVKSYLAACHFVVLPFILVPSEVPISILEAMEAGKPVIATNVDGIPELLDKTGIVVNPGDTRALTTAVVTLAKDKTYRTRLSTNCRSYMKNYPTWKESLFPLRQFLFTILK